MDRRLGFDVGRSYAVPVLPPGGDEDYTRENTRIIDRFERFVLEFYAQEGDVRYFKYRDELQQNLRAGHAVLRVDLEDLLEQHEDLEQKLRHAPSSTVPLLETALLNVARRLLGDQEKIPHSVQLQVRTTRDPMSFGDLQASRVGELLKIRGIVLSCGVPASRASRLHIVCKNCRHTTSIDVPGGISGFSLPRRCGANKMPDGQAKECPLDPYTVVHAKSTFVNQQMIKLQEVSDAVRTGELPRHILVVADRLLANQLVPGSHVQIVGIFTAFDSLRKSGSGGSGGPSIKTPYVRMLGFDQERESGLTNRARPRANAFSDMQVQSFREMSQDPNLYENLAASVAPSIYGCEDVKKAILCLLFGGSRRVLADGIRLRGDINVLLLGDPSTAKSQLLKFTQQVAPVAVYTSGKGSSAAGLTASVIRDAQTGEFHLEGGAMVLADGGVVCIDEFDKMREEDRVAIHEAMEQQTISIAKAGITAILNSRTSVLAAANPVFGRYDDSRSPGENIDFQTTILSRFDMIFIIRDNNDQSHDRQVARHIMNMNFNGRAASAPTTAGPYSLEQVTNYIKYCRQTSAPCLNDAASDKLCSDFVTMRSQLLDLERQNNTRSSIPIAIRQIEAIIRISESLAKMQLSDEVDIRHVDEAVRLFHVSTMRAISADADSSNANARLNNDTRLVEQQLLQALPLGYSMSYSRLYDEIVRQRHFSSTALDRATQILARREVIRFVDGRRLVTRTGA